MKKNKEVETSKKNSGVKTRLTVGIIAALFGIFVLFNINTVFFVIVVAAIATMAVFEVLHVTQIKNIALIIIGTVTAPLVFVYMVYRPELPIFAIAVLYVMLLLVIMVTMHEKTRFEHVVITVFASVCIPVAMSCFALIRDLYKVYPDFTEYECMFLMLSALYGCWMTDTGAFFAGSKFGKHKLCPKISPKKTVEGAIGGIACTVIVTLITLAVYNHFFFAEPVFTYWGAALVAAVLSVLSMFGDLSASVIKRNYGAKDFGKIMPGHGGAMDRFDSFLFVVPAMYLIVTLAQNI